MSLCHDGKFLDHRLRVPLEVVVHRALALRGGALVIHAQPAADIDRGDRRTGIAQFHPGARDFLQRPAKYLDAGDLRTGVAVQQGQAIEHAGLLQAVDQRQRAGGGESELGTIAAGVLPVAGRHRGQAHAQAKLRFHLHGSGGIDDQFQLGQLLDHQHHAVAETLCDERQADVLGVLVAVADDGTARRQAADDGHQLGLAAALQPDAAAAVRDDGIHHVLLLVDLDRVDGGVARTVVMRLHGRGKGVVQPVHLAVQDIGEAHQHGQGQSLFVNPFDQRFQVDGRAVRSAARPRQQVTVVAHIEIAAAPAGDAVQPA